MFRLKKKVTHIEYEQINSKISILVSKFVLNTLTYSMLQFKLRV